MSNSIVISGSLVTIPAVRNKEAEASKKVATGLLQIESANQSATISLLAFGQVAESISQEDLNVCVLIEGQLHSESEQLPDGTKKNYLQIVVSRYHILPQVSGFSIKMSVVNLMGRLGSDPDVRYFESGSCKSQVSLAVNRTKDKTDWLRIVAWNDQASRWADWLKKGTQISVTGTLQFSIGKNGQTYWEVNCQKFAFAGSKGDSQSQPSASTSSPQSNGKVLVSSVASTQAVDNTINLEDIPY